jgi:hypothetical protein
MPTELKGGECSHQEDSVGEPRERVDLPIPIGKIHRRWPFTHDCSCKANCEPEAIEEHMNTISEEPEGSSNEAIEELHQHEAEVEAVVAVSDHHTSEKDTGLPAKIRDSTSVAFSHNRVHNGARSTEFQQSSCKLGILY